MDIKSIMPKFPEPYWRDSVRFPQFPKLEESINVDVGIVGGGITGITTAYLLAKQNVKVALIDSDVILNGTTGHTTAKVTAQHGLIYDEFIQHFGLEKASLYYQACTEAKEMIEQTINELEIDCDFKKEDAYIYTNSDTYLSKLETEKKAYDQLNIPSELTESIPLDIPIKSALVMKNQAQFHPLQYLRALLEECVNNGVKLYENTAALDIKQKAYPTIVTRDDHHITCRHVVTASHFPFNDGNGFYFSRMYPERAYVIGIKTNKKFPGGMYINAESPTRSIRTTTIGNEDLWLIGGENHKTGQGIPTIDHYKALQSFAEKHFGIDKFLYRWSTQDLTTLDKVPYIGPMTKEQPSVFIATGFRKWGMTNGTIAAKIISDRILGEDSPYEDLYSPSRFQADPAIKKFTSMNADVAKHFIKGKLEYADNSVKDLSSDEAMVTHINGQRVGVYKDTKYNLHALDTTCTHMRCEVEWNAGDRTWDCPCHGSRFSYTGEIIEGPARKPLPKVDLE
ncbi:FAD-dependent oxidoreductase [Oceanobacillus halotolerans]|uniref:FAD-dependent oxidoreductase n=1 Tax=Oceanobacillus halotolerans TaxID=2663380 RepID=UPI0013DCEDC3|nr:FAD-dependent oxidoreductase [Oceanobacillus halotolerans]